MSAPVDAKKYDLLAPEAAKCSVCSICRKLSLAWRKAPSKGGPRRHPRYVCLMCSSRPAPLEVPHVDKLLSPVVQAVQSAGRRGELA